jgi:hypothetical protein
MFSSGAKGLNMLQAICSNLKYWISLVLLHWNKAEIKVTGISSFSNMGQGTEGRKWKGEGEGQRKGGRKE